MKSTAFWLAWLKGECGIELSFSTTLSSCENGLGVRALFRQPFTRTLVLIDAESLTRSAVAREIFLGRWPPCDTHAQDSKSIDFGIRVFTPSRWTYVAASFRC